VLEKAAGEETSEAARGETMDALEPTIGEVSEGHSGGLFDAIFGRRVSDVVDEPGFDAGGD
jgi:hypothetical protein